MAERSCNAKQQVCYELLGTFSRPIHAWAGNQCIAFVVIIVLLHIPIASLSQCLIMHQAIRTTSRTHVDLPNVAPFDPSETEVVEGDLPAKVTVVSAAAKAISDVSLSDSPSLDSPSSGSHPHSVVEIAVSPVPHHDQGTQAYPGHPIEVSVVPHSHQKTQTGLSVSQVQAVVEAMQTVTSTAPSNPHLTSTDSYSPPKTKNPTYLPSSLSSSSSPSPHHSPHYPTNTSTHSHFVTKSTSTHSHSVPSCPPAPAPSPPTPGPPRPPS
jgi:hypothetical protein